jgi:putative transcriptional regulator
MAEKKATAFGTTLRELRLAAGLTHAELARRVGMHRFGITKLEYGHRDPSWETALALARALGLPATVFQQIEPRTRGSQKKGLSMRDGQRRVFQAITKAWLNNLDAIEQRVLQIEEEKLRWERREPGRRDWSFEEALLNPLARSACNSPPRGAGLWYPNGLPRKHYEMDALGLFPGYLPVPVEIALVTNVTEAKWIRKINDDTKKLAMLAALPGLQIIASFETFDLAKSASWTKFFNRLYVWNVDPPFVVERKILDAGVMLIKGFEIPTSRDWWEVLSLKQTIAHQ